MRKIKAYTLHEGAVVFNIIEQMPEVGDFYNGEEILEIHPVKLASCRQPFAHHEVQSDGEHLEFYNIVTTFNGDAEETDEYYIACWGKDEEE